MSDQLLKNLSAKEKAELKASLIAEEKEEKKRIAQDREDYKVLVSETVGSLFERLKALSKSIVEEKSNVFKSFEQILDMKSNLYGIKTDQQSHTFTSTEGKISIKLGHRVIDSYDDTVNVGVTKVNDFLKTLARDENSAALVETVLKLLRRDENGNLKASRVIELEQLAHKTGNEMFLDGIRIIKESYHPVRSCQFVTVSFKDENGKESFLPLSMSSAE
jgi:hypothetical protein